MNFDKFMGILIGAVLSAFAAYFISGLLHDIWVMWAR